MFLLKQILPAVIVALVVAAGICGLTLWFGRARTRNALAACAVGCGYLCGHLMITGWVGFPPADTTNWLIYFALAAVVLGAMDAMLSVLTWVRLGVFILFCAVALRLLLKPIS